MSESECRCAVSRGDVCQLRGTTVQVRVGRVLACMPVGAEGPWFECDIVGGRESVMVCRSQLVACECEASTEQCAQLGRNVDNSEGCQIGRCVYTQSLSISGPVLVGFYHAG